METFFLLGNASRPVCAEDVANLQKQLVEAREQLDAKDQIIKVSW